MQANKKNNIQYSAQQNIQWFSSSKNKQPSNEMLPSYRTVRVQLTDVVNGEENDFPFFIWENQKLFLKVFFF